MGLKCFHSTITRLIVGYVGGKKSHKPKLEFSELFSVTHSFMNGSVLDFIHLEEWD